LSLVTTSLMQNFGYNEKGYMEHMILRQNQMR
jgi:hypothetical protein